MNIVCYFERVARRSPDAVAVRCDAELLTFAGLRDAAARFAAYAAHSGVTAGDRVLVSLPNRPATLVVLLGLWKAGGVAVLVNPALPPTALRDIAAECLAGMVVGCDEHLERLRDAFAGTPGGERLVTVGCSDAADDRLPAILSRTAPATQTIGRLDDEDAVLMYTSGSTGPPKGVRQTHRNVMAASEATAMRWDTGPADRVLLPVPLFHVGGLQFVALPALLSGASVTIMSRWSASRWCELVADELITISALVGTMLVDVGNLTLAARGHLSTLRVCTVGGSGIPRASIQRFIEATGVEPIQVYGQTEQNGLMSCHRSDRFTHEGAIGRPLAEIVRWRVTDRSGVDVSAGEVGELRVCGDAVVPGYWRPEDEERARFADGWFRTGDLVRADSDGQLLYVGRTDDMIISGGENVHPIAVERLLAECEQVDRVAVIGTPHERYIEQVTAVVVPRGVGVEERDIEEFCRMSPELIGAQRPRRIEFIAELPLTATGKVDRAALRRRFAPVAAGSA